MKKGIILAGGMGTRLFPITRCMSKQLLPVYDKPMIYYPLSVLMLAGINEVLIITTKEDSDRFVKLLGDGSYLGMKISYTTQEKPAGIAHSFIVAEKFINNSPVALILGDNIFHGKNLQSLLKQAALLKDGASVFATEVEKPEKYGVVQKDKDGKVTRLLEKPEKPPTNLAVTGLYFYDEHVVDMAKGLKPSPRGELEITDINNIYLENHKLNVTIFDKTIKWYDTGSFETLFNAAAYVKNAQEDKGEPVGFIELIAHQNGWISKPELEELSLKSQKSGYGNRILSSL